MIYNRLRIISCYIHPLQQVASQLNAAILKAEHYESSQSKLAVSMRMLLWAQEELDRKMVRYPHMQLSTGQVEEPK